MTIALATLDREVARDGRAQLPGVSLVAAICRRCEMDVLVVWVGENRFPVQLEISQITVVADTGRVSVGHPVHDLAVCAIREANSQTADARRDRLARVGGHAG